MTLGPVYNAQHSEPSAFGGLFGLAAGLATLAYVWVRYSRLSADEPKPPIGNMVWISFIACMFIAMGIWQLIRVL